jgi:anti-anti-sigma regulatory factor
MAARPKKDTPRAEPSVALPVVDLDIFGIRPLWEEARAWAADAQAGEFRLDLSGAGDLDLSGFQLLMALDQALRGKGGTLVLEGVRPEWLERMARLGMTRLVECCRQVPS